MCYQQKHSGMCLIDFNEDVMQAEKKFNLRQG